MRMLDFGETSISHFCCDLFIIRRYIYTVHCTSCCSEMVPGLHYKYLLCQIDKIHRSVRLFLLGPVLSRMAYLGLVAIKKERTKKRDLF